MATEKLENSLVEQIKNLKNKQAEIVLTVGQLHLELKELGLILEASENEYTNISQQLNQILSQLEQKYPNGEVDLVEGTVTF